MAAVTSQATNPSDNQLTDFGPNEWLVEDMYQQYLADPSSVAPAWHDFFVGYQPFATGAPNGADGSAGATATAAQPTTAPAEAPTPEAAPAAAPAPAATPKAAPKAAAETTIAGAHTAPIRGVAAKIVSNMDASLSVPTATSVRAVPAKLLSDNRIVINNALARGRGGKVSFTHLIGYAMVQALASHPEMNNSFDTVNGKPVT